MGFCQAGGEDAQAKRGDDQDALDASNRIEIGVEEQRRYGESLPSAAADARGSSLQQAESGCGLAGPGIVFSKAMAKGGCQSKTEAPRGVADLPFAQV